jgi:hypothetical protein
VPYEGSSLQHVLLDNNINHSTHLMSSKRC